MDNLASTERGRDVDPRPPATTPLAIRADRLLGGFVILSGLAVMATHLHLVNLAVRADQYRHLSRIVIPVFADHESTTLLWSNHHPSPFLHLYQYLSLSISSFDERLDFAGGVVASMAIGWMLVDASPVRRRALGGNPAVLALVTLAAAVVISKASVIYTTWPLVTFQVVFVAFGMGLQKLLLSTRYTEAARTEATGRFAVRCAATSALTLGLLLIHGTVGTFFAGGAAATLAALAMLDRTGRRAVHRLLVIAGIVGTTVAGYRFGVSRSASSAGSNVGIDPGQTAAQLRHVADYGQTVGAHVLEPTIGIEFLTTQLGSAGRMVDIGVAVATVAIVAVAARNLERTAFLVASSLTLLGMLAGTTVTAATRFPELAIWAEALAAPRYDHYFAILFAILSVLVACIVQERPTSLFSLFITGVVLLEVLALSYRAISPSEALANRSLAVANREELLTYMEGIDPDNEFTLTGASAGNNGAKVYEPVLEWLRDNELNVFDPDAVLHSQTEAYKAANAVMATGTELEVVPPGEDGCVRLAPDDGLVAWRAGVDVAATGRWHVRIADDGTGEIVDQYELVPGRLTLLGTVPGSEPVRVCPSDQARITDFRYAIAPG